MVRKLALTIALASLVAIPAGAQETNSKPAKPSATDVAKRVQQFYAQTKDYQAKFTQTYHDLAAGSKKVNVGTVYFKKPGKMRWDYMKTTGKRDKLYVSDGSNFWVYEYDFKQVFKQCLKDSQLPTSLSFLMGQGNLLTDFNVKHTKKSTATKPEILLTPKKPTSSYKELRFTLDPKTFQVMRTVIYDPYGNMNEIQFAKVKVNNNLPDKGFDFKVPKGARVLNPQQKCP